MKKKTIILLAEEQRAILFRQLGQMEHAGLSPVQAFNTLTVQGPKASIICIQRTVSALRKGIAVSQAGFNTGLFSKFDRDCLIVAEESGGLEAIYLQLSDFYTEKTTRRKKIRSQMVYPVVIFIVAIFIQPLPELVKGSMSLGAYIAYIIKSLLVLSVVFWLIAKVPYWLQAGRLNTVKPVWDHWQLMLPGIAGWYQRRAFRDFFAHISLLLSSGVPLFTAWDKSCAVIQNEVLRSTLSRIKADLEAGAGLGDALQPLTGVSPVLKQLIHTGEHAGTLDQMITHFVKMESENIALSDKAIADWLPRIFYALVVIWVVSGML